MSKKACMSDIKWIIEDCLDQITATLDDYGYLYDADINFATTEFKSYPDFKRSYDKCQAKFLLNDIIDHDAFTTKGLQKLGKNLITDEEIINSFKKNK